MERLITKFMWKGKGLIKSKAILKKEKKVGGVTLLHFKTYYESPVTETDSIDIPESLKTPNFSCWNFLISVSGIIACIILVSSYEESDKVLLSSYATVS
jgi:hypothetical protein